MALCIPCGSGSGSGSGSAQLEEGCGIDLAVGSEPGTIEISVKYGPTLKCVDGVLDVVDGGSEPGSLLRIVSFAVDGPLHNAGLSPLRFYNLFGEEQTISRVGVSLGEAPTGDDVIIDVLIDGVSIFAAEADMPHVLIGQFYGESTAIATTVWPADTYFSVEVVQYGSVQPGKNMTVEVVVEGAGGGGGGSGHAAVTLDADANTVLSLSSQEIGLDTQASATVFAGPVSGADNEPTFRALEATDIPLLAHGTLDELGLDQHPQYHNDSRAATWHTAIGNASPHHPPVSLIAGASELAYINALQQLGFYSQASGTFLGGPLSGADALPTFREMDASDIPLLDHGTHLLGLNDDDHPGYLNTARHDAIGDSFPHHAAATLDTDADELLTIAGQVFGLRAQAAGTFLAGPVSGVDAVPTFREVQTMDISPLTADLDFNRFKAIAAACDNGSTFPSAPATGLWYYRTDVDVLYIYDGAWKPIIGFSALNLYVDGTLGSNGDGQGFSAGVGATATIAAALNLVPPIIPNGATINVAAGTYAGNFTVPRTVGTISIYGAYTEVASGTTTASYCASSQTQTGTLSTVGTSAVVTVTGGAGTTNVYPGTIVFVTTNKALAGIVLTVDSATQFTLDRALDLSAGSYAWGVSGSAHVDSGAAWADDEHNGRLVVLSPTGTPSTDAARAFPVYDTDSAKKSLFVVGVTSGFTVSGLTYSVRTLDTTITGQITINSAGVGSVVLRWLKYTRSSGTMITAQERSVDIRACELVSSGTSSVFQVRDTGRLTVQNCRIAGTTSLYGALIFAIGYMEMRYTEWSVYSTGAYASIWVYYSSGYADFVNGYLCGASTGAAFLLITTQSFWRAIGANTLVYMSGTSRAVQLRYGSQTLDAATTSAYIYGFSETIVPQTQTYGMSDAVTLIQNYPNTTAPSTTSDQSKVWAQDQDGTAGNSGLHVKSETGDVYSFGDHASFDAGLIVNELGGSAAADDLRAESDTEANMLWLDASADTMYLGGNTNAVKVVKGGELTLIGTATRWEDLRIEPVARTTGSNAPTFEKWYDDAPGSSRGVYLYSFDDANAGSEKEVFFTMQMPHQWAGTSIDVHVHWVGAVADTTAAPRWGLEYVWKDIGQVFGDTAIVYSDGSNYTDVGTDADIVANKHYISKFAALAPGSTADAMSSILIGRLFRDSANAADTYNAAGAKCGLLYIDAHYELDAMGSAQEYVK